MRTLYLNRFYKETNKSYRLLRSSPHNSPYWLGSCFVVIESLVHTKEKKTHMAKVLFIVTTEPLRVGRMYNPKKLLAIVPKRMEYDDYVKAISS